MTDNNSQQSVARPTEPKFYGGVGLAIMAAELAAKRVPVCGGRFGGMGTYENQFRPMSREDVAAHNSRSNVPLTSGEYYLIIDRIARGERP